MVGLVRLPVIEQRALNEWAQLMALARPHVLIDPLTR